MTQAVGFGARQEKVTVDTGLRLIKLKQMNLPPTCFGPCMSPFPSVVTDEPSACTEPVPSCYSRRLHQHSSLLLYQLSSLHCINATGNPISLFFKKTRNILISLACPATTPYLCTSLLPLIGLFVFCLQFPPHVFPSLCPQFH
ncbi:hypothetical protein HJG60_011312 [Phyllostomus discolor]|uniref:Uncharacterized protein n=1 Tax=Phyllostomus discolor TaxID=89673 RepID=A0A834A7G4_9CHIR|nr:hypothetical protein HJG60_011312 [Phyllostomus discolor]